MLMKHLNGGVRKGAFDEAAAKSKFEAWKQEKEAPRLLPTKTLLKRRLKLKLALKQKKEGK